MATLAPPMAEQNLPEQAPASFSEALHRYWGYESFRPGQESIVRSIAAGRDACVVMPTGGGKSLCYQLPAVLHATTTVVISPLIALMQDQVAQLLQMGISAACLNAATPPRERSHILQYAATGKYQLLYLSPERIAISGTVEWLKSLPISFFAIDEAHCISEWGHEFRPEYRQLNRLRELFPDRPIAAFTASATQRVRHDIIEQLRLRDPYKHIASFRRPNLRYIVRQCGARTQNELLLRAVKQVSDGSIIVYAPTIARVGDTVDFLEENGIAAIGYHGQMESAARRENQEKWMADEVRVMVGTMAFGQCDVCAAVPDWLETETNEGKRSRGRPRVTQPVRAAQQLDRSMTAKPSVDKELNEFLREWRRNTAKNQGIAAFVVLHDSALEDLCLVEPSNLQELRRVSGFGDKRVEMYGKEILDVFRRFRQGERATNEGKLKVSSPAKETLRLLKEGRTFEEIAQIRARTLRAVVSLVADLIERGEAQFQSGWLAPERYNQIAAAC